MKTVDTTGPWDLTTVQRVLMEGFKEGARLAASDADVREHARDAAELEDAFAGAARRAAERAAWHLTDSLATDFPRQWSEWVEPVMAAAVDAALVLGARAIAGAEEEAGADLEFLAEDELWLAPEVDHLVLQVAEAFLEAGHALPGARAFLSRVRPTPEPEILVVRGGKNPELRTGWIRDADSGRCHQWCLRRDGDLVCLSRRRRGSRRTEGAVRMSAGDAAVIGRLLQSVASHVDSP